MEDRGNSHSETLYAVLEAPFHRAELSVTSIFRPTILCYFVFEKFRFCNTYYKCRDSFSIQNIRTSLVPYIIHVLPNRTLKCFSYNSFCTSGGFYAQVYSIIHYLSIHACKVRKFLMYFYL